jgi:hypothetical protein
VVSQAAPQHHCSHAGPVAVVCWLHNLCSLLPVSVTLVLVSIQMILLFHLSQAGF